MRKRPNRLNHQRRASGEADWRELDKITRSIKEIVALVEDGSGSGALLARLRELEAREDELRARLAQAPMDIPDIRPNVAGIYRWKVEGVAEALQRPPERDEAVEAIRALIEDITSRPGPGVATSPRRCLATSARSSNGRLKNRTLAVGAARECRFEMVAGTGSNLNLQTQKGRPLRAAGLRDFASQVEMVAGARNRRYRAAPGGSIGVDILRGLVPEGLVSVNIT